MHVVNMTSTCNCHRHFFFHLIWVTDTTTTTTATNSNSSITIIPSTIFKLAILYNVNCAYGITLSVPRLAMSACDDVCLCVCCRPRMSVVQRSGTGPGASGSSSPGCSASSPSCSSPPSSASWRLTRARGHGARWRTLGRVSHQPAAIRTGRTAEIGGPQSVNMCGAPTEVTCLRNSVWRRYRQSSITSTLGQIWNSTLPTRCW